MHQQNDRLAVVLGAYFGPPIVVRNPLWCWATVVILWNTGALWCWGGRLSFPASAEPFGNYRCRSMWTWQIRRVLDASFLFHPTKSSRKGANTLPPPPETSRSRPTVTTPQQSQKLLQLFRKTLSSIFFFPYDRSVRS